MGTAFVWDNTANAWASDHWGRGGVSPTYPGDTGSDPADTVTIDCETPPTDGPASYIKIAAYVCRGNGFNELTTGNLEVTEALELGTPGGTDAPGFCGDGLAATCRFYGRSYSTGGIGADAEYHDEAVYQSGSTTGDVHLRGVGAHTGTFGADVYVFCAGADVSGATVTGTVYLAGRGATVVAGDNTVQIDPAGAGPLVFGD